jgi:hypothetical protein
MSVPSRNPSFSQRLGEALTRGLNPSQVEAVTYPSQPLPEWVGADRKGKPKGVSPWARLPISAKPLPRVAEVPFT